MNEIKEVVTPNTYYLLRVYFDSNNVDDISLTSIELFLTKSKFRKKFDVPVVNDNIHYLEPGKWLEKYILFRTPLNETELTIFFESADKIKYSIIEFTIELTSADFEKLYSRGCQRFSSMFQKINEKNFFPFERWELKSDIFASNSLIFESQKIKINQCSCDNKIAFIGDRIYNFVEFLSDVVIITKENYRSLIGDNFNYIFIQEDSACLLTDLYKEVCKILPLTNAKILFFRKKDSDGSYLQLTSIEKDKKHDCKYSFPIINIMKIIPISKDHSTFTNIMVATSESINHNHYFRDCIYKLKYDKGYSINFFELTYNSTPIRISNSNLFDLSDVSVNFNCNYDYFLHKIEDISFVLFDCSVKHDVQDIIMGASIVLSSGAIPIILGREILFYENCFKFVFSYEELLLFIKRTSNVLSYHRLWLMMYRELRIVVNKRKNNEIIQLANIDNLDDSASLICVTNRLDCLSNIISNVKRQTHKNLELHIVYNIEPTLVDIAKQNIDKIKNEVENLNVHFIDSIYNLGYCMNYAIDRSTGRYWFKIDDDDYYGKNYIADMVMWYNVTGYPVIGKRQFFVSEDYLGLYTRKFKNFLYFKSIYDLPYGLCGATLSGMNDKNLPRFSVDFIGSIDTKWQELLMKEKITRWCGDLFNFCLIRTNDLSKHTWQVSFSEIIQNYVTSFDEDYINV